MKWYSKVTVETFYTDEDGIILDKKYKSNIIASDSVETLKKSVGVRAEASASDNIDILTTRMEVRSD